jgi:hypothetical protein
MNALFNDKCRSFAKEIKKESDSWMSENMNYNQLVLLRNEYNWILRQKKNAEPDDEIYSFYSFDPKIKDTARYSVKLQKNLSNDQLLKLLISVDIFYLPIDSINRIVLNK